MDVKDEDKTLESYQKHLIFYNKLDQKISDIKKEIISAKDEKILSHLNERIKAIDLDKERIRKMFPDKNFEK